MVSLQQHSTIEKLPNDVLSNMLIGLKSKQLAQMRCISKPFNEFLSQPSFIKSHLDRSVHYNDEILMVFLSYPFSFDHLPFTTDATKSPELELENFIKIPVNAPAKDVNCFVVGSVNGLICFYNQPYHVCTLYIWNPSLSALMALPPYTMPSRSYDILFRFGFDPKTDDYKVVKLTSLVPPRNKPRSIYPKPGYMVIEWLQVEVYSMRKGSWNIIAQRFPSHVKWIGDRSEVYVDGHNGYLHWLGYLDKEQKLQTIVAFDLGVETFNELSLPDVNESRINVLGVMAGKLCVMSSVNFGKSYEVWVMDEYGVVESWAKQHVFSQFGDYISPFGFTLNNEFLFGKGHHGVITLYNPVKGKIKSFYPTEKPIIYDKYHKTKIVHYVDSLVWVASSESSSTVDCKFKRKDCITVQEIVRKSKRLNKLPLKLKE